MNWISRERKFNMPDPGMMFDFPLNRKMPYKAFYVYTQVIPAALPMGKFSLRGEICLFDEAKPAGVLPVAEIDDDQAASGTSIATIGTFIEPAANISPGFDAVKLWLGEGTPFAPPEFIWVNPWRAYVEGDAGCFRITEHRVISGNTAEYWYVWLGIRETKERV